MASFTVVAQQFSESYTIIERVFLLKYLSGNGLKEWEVDRKLRKIVMVTMCMIFMYCIPPIAVAERSETFGEFFNTDNFMIKLENVELLNSIGSGRLSHVDAPDGAMYICHRLEL